MWRELPTIHPVSSSAKLRELIIISMNLDFSFIKRARLIRPPEINPGSLCPMFFVPL